MTPQEMFAAVVEFDQDIAKIAVDMTTMPLRAKQDHLARIAVASEGVEKLLEGILSAPGALPFRDKFEALRKATGLRTRALQEFIIVGDFAIGAMVNVSSIAESTGEILFDLIASLQELEAARALGAFLTWAAQEDEKETRNGKDDDAG